LAIPHGVHLRRLHYLLFSTATIVFPNGKPYENTHNCWEYLGRASSDARYLDLVPRGELEDTVGVFALVVDSDADKGLGWTPTIVPSLTVETSPVTIIIGSF
jgi:hypothetical protein